MRTNVYKHTLMCLVAMCAVSASIAQATSASDDGSKGDNSLFKQQKKNWSVGIHAGMPWISGDQLPQLGYGYGINVRKALGHSFSVRLNAINGVMYGYDHQKSGKSILERNPGLNGELNPSANYFAAGRAFYTNYQNSFTIASLQGVYNINNINFLNEYSRVGLYVFGGVGAMLYETRIDALDANGQLYDFSAIDGGGKDIDKKKVIAELKSTLDGTYESYAEGQTPGQSFTNRAKSPMFNLGAGVNFRVSPRVDLHLEGQYGFTGSDLLDGQQHFRGGSLTPQPDGFMYVNAGVNVRLGKTDQVYWFTNPLALPYKTMAETKKKVNDMEKTLDDMDKKVKDLNGRVDTLSADADGDGVSDYFDQELESPAGAIVDGAGRTMMYKNADGDLVFVDPTAAPIPTNFDPYSGDPQKNPEGTKFRNEDDGTKYITYPDGTVYQQASDGTRYKKTPDGTTYRTDPDGTSYRVKPDGTSAQISYDGSSANVVPSGGKKTVYDSRKPSAVVLKSDGKGGFYNGGASGAGTNTGLGFMPAIFFDSDNSHVKASYYPEIYQVAMTMKANPNAKLTILGHTDSRSSEAYNQQLGMMRAKAVASILTNYFGVPASQLNVVSKGEAEPLARANGMDALAMNRRVQFQMGDGKTSSPQEKTPSGGSNVPKTGSFNSPGGPSAPAKSGTSTQGRSGIEKSSMPLNSDQLDEEMIQNQSDEINSEGEKKDTLEIIDDKIIDPTMQDNDNFIETPSTTPVKQEPMGFNKPAGRRGR